jgi:hypothetical protein
MIDEREKKDPEKIDEDRTYEGERIAMLLQMMEREDEKVVMVDMEGDYSDEEGDTMPKKWSQISFGENSVSNTRENEWEYKEYEVIQGGPNIKTLRQ